MYVDGHKHLYLFKYVSCLGYLPCNVYLNIFFASENKFTDQLKSSQKWREKRTEKMWRRKTIIFNFPSTIYVVFIFRALLKGRLHRLLDNDRKHFSYSFLNSYGK